ncbi:uncharacterized protein LOC106877455 [Octopus bimaculoides]|uniref:uncharacterized protein LOC106877455 n=1 Tax=Octopus bimaculoides TaxID=37653 RepID=UPI00071E4FAF|nr:uncharacterized protein LOC106877455 [Octopus bimaculoides]|eukprot:XP_014781847.1 PREDICTED: uncharacterized protein LOC106877455 [Octopus bimaculoides]
MVVTLGDDASGLSAVQKCTNECRRRTEILEDDITFGGPATATSEENIDCVHEMEMDDQRLTINQITNAISISRKSVENILYNNICIMKVSAPWVPYILTTVQKHTRLFTSKENLTMFEADPTT